MPSSKLDPLTEEPGEEQSGAFQANTRVVLALCLAALGIWTTRGFLVSMSWALVIAVASWPLYRWLRLRAPQWMRGIVLPLIFTLVIGVALIGPLTYAAIKLGEEARILARWLTSIQKSGLPAPDWLNRIPAVGTWLFSTWNSSLGSPGAAEMTLGHLDPAFILRWTRTLGVQMLRRAEVLAFTLLTLFFLYRDGEALGKQALRFARRLVGSVGVEYARHCVSAIRATVNGLVLVSIGEGILLGVAYAVAGITDPVTLGGLTGILAMVPFLAPLVFGGVSIMLYAQGSVLTAIGIFLFGSLVLFVADHFIRPGLIGGAAHLPFFWVLLGTLGGITSFGLLGLFLGPTVIAALLAAWYDFIGRAAEE
ncbi:AI-2E family transporter [Methylacidimicrobium sp. B4]|uniref:AI-2E family transporter n=1 Tax=Methylacidimicrobium sp. B4 TaxID=2796139 RepID=UPI001A8D8F78|nr:AI-2E family transporter [Methylacidimicrobium sp. B4]QSR84438.1 AI-2E family transporter [Methylacidimicrobium sp. B4]